MRSLAEHLCVKFALVRWIQESNSRGRREGDQCRGQAFFVSFIVRRIFIVPNRVNPCHKSRSGPPKLLEHDLPSTSKPGISITTWSLAKSTSSILAQPIL
ncbi:hypothetical protein ACMFMG_004390 [Clarireedia jacksonii]